MATYTIFRFFEMDKNPIMIKEGLTLEEAKAHCDGPESFSKTATLPDAVAFTQEYGHWVDLLSEDLDGQVLLNPDGSARHLIEDELIDDVFTRPGHRKTQ